MVSIVYGDSALFIVSLEIYFGDTASVMGTYIR